MMPNNILWLSSTEKVIYTIRCFSDNFDLSNTRTMYLRISESTVNSTVNRFVWTVSLRLKMRTSCRGFLTTILWASECAGPILIVSCIYILRSCDSVPVPDFSIKPFKLWCLCVTVEDKMLSQENHRWHQSFGSCPQPMWLLTLSIRSHSALPWCLWIKNELRLQEIIRFRAL